MVIVKPHQIYIFYGIFTSFFTFKVCWEIPCGEAFYFVETIQLIRGADQMSRFYMVRVSTVMNIRADYRFCCFNINKLSCHVTFKKGSCATDLLVLYLSPG